MTISKIETDKEFKQQLHIQGKLYSEVNRRINNLKPIAKQLKKEIMKSLSKNWFQLNKEERMILELAITGLSDLIDYDSLSHACQAQIIQRVQKAEKIIQGVAK